MHMSYWLGTRLEDFLFYGYNIVNSWGLISTCMGLSALAILYEAMKLSQFKLRELTKKENPEPSSTLLNTDRSSLISRVSERSINILTYYQCYTSIKWFIEIVHWSAQVTLGYFLMLGVMTYNGYISIALVVGSGIGYYIFGPILIEIHIRNLQVHHKLSQCNPECADAIMNPVVQDHLETSEANVNADIDIHVIHKV